MRAVRFTVWLAVAEMEALVSAAALLGLSASAIFRAAVLNDRALGDACRAAVKIAATPERHPERFTVLLAESEHAEIIRAATAAGLDASSYVRARVFGYAQNPRHAA